MVDMVRCPLSVPEISAAIAETRDDPQFARWAPPGSRAVFRWSRRDGTALFVDRPGRPADNGGGAFFTQDTPVLGSLKVPARGFWQMNDAVGSALVAAVADAIRVAAPRSLVDLYCGVGVFGLSAARLGVKRVLGVESGRDAVRAAARNAR
ncbi:MAG: 50S ribosomal protein L11 methyltransferase, partial [Kiritimatiellae bacterium]|nr:50S ribosomal protein L11 methyltransferase [Kiritimatiellia bacterium]